MSSDRAANFDEDERQCYAVFQSFLVERHQREMVEILRSEDSSACYSVVVNSLELFDSNIKVSQMLVTNPRKVLPVFHLALHEALRSLFQSHLHQAGMSSKTNVCVRLSNLPTCPELTRNTIPRSSDIGRLLAVTGKITINQTDDGVCRSD